MIPNFKIIFVKIYIYGSYKQCIGTKKTQTQTMTQKKKREEEAVRKRERTRKSNCLFLFLILSFEKGSTVQQSDKPTTTYMKMWNYG